VTTWSPWSLVTVVGDGEPFVAARMGNGSVREVPALKQWASLTELVDGWPVAAEALRAIDVEAAAPLVGVRLLAPLRYPRKVICAGVNYGRHMAEMGTEPLSADWTPFFFLKPPTTAVVGPYDDVPVDGPDAARLDWEAELAVVIGVGGRAIARQDALAHVAGYCVANDLTARGYHRRASVPADAFRYDWFASKARDGSLPLGPGLTPAWLVPDPHDLWIRLWVNDELQQDGSTADMICDIPTLVAAASEAVTLEPGDVISTGTPAGVGAGRGMSLRPGDVVRTEVEHLGVLVNRIVAADRRPQRRPRTPYRPGLEEP
jgi:2-keto-4-pentenoate hydratase/2-oxohepta-3-ene-1,7-dioic acid hydratase in catechol pathway